MTRKKYPAERTHEGRLTILERCVAVLARRLMKAERKVGIRAPRIPLPLRRKPPVRS